MKRKVILNLAISLDGFICDLNGGFDWIKGEGDNTLDTKTQIDFMEFVDTCDAVVMGHKAYLDAPEGSLEIYGEKTIYVISNDDHQSEKENIKFIKGDVVNYILKESQKEGKNIFVYGGGVIVDLFVKANAIDEYIVGIIPVILGNGRKLFFDNNPTIELHLEETSISDGIVIMRYSKR